MLITKTFKCSLLVHVYGEWDMHAQQAYIIDGHAPGVEVVITNRMSSLVINRKLRDAGHIVPPKTTWYLDEENCEFRGTHPLSCDGYGLLEYDDEETTISLSKSRIRAMVRKRLLHLMRNDSFCDEMAKWVCDDSVRNRDGGIPIINWRD